MTQKIYWITVALAVVAASFGCVRTGQVRTMLPQACEACGKPIVRGQEVTLSAENGERHIFRCVHCALVQQEGKYPNSSFRTASPETRKEIWVVRMGEEWSTRPKTVVFLILPEAAGECLDRHKAFADQSELASYLVRHKSLSKLKPKIYTILDLKTMLPAGLPQPNATP